MRKTSGVSLMLLIFLSLCLIIFSLLSLSGAVADETLSSQAADRTTEYYAAVSSANGLLAQIDTQLAAYLREVETAEPAEESTISDSLEYFGNSNAEPETVGSNSAEHQKSAYLQLCSQIGEDVPGVAWEDSESASSGDGIVSFSVDAGEDQILQVRLGITYPGADDDHLYHIQTWKIVNTGDWNADDSMNLFRSGDQS